MGHPSCPPPGRYHHFRDRHPASQSNPHAGQRQRKLRNRRALSDSVSRLLRKLVARTLRRAAAAALFHHVPDFMNDYEFQVLSVSQAASFHVETTYITEINGQAMETYIDWMMLRYFSTVTDLPSPSLPLGFTEEELPVGLQIAGRHQDDFGLLQVGYAI